MVTKERVIAYFQIRPQQLPGGNEEKK